MKAVDLVLVISALVPLVAAMGAAVRGGRWRALGPVAPGELVGQADDLDRAGERGGQART